MNNNSYVIISADKLRAIFMFCCPPPYTSDDHCERLAYEDCDGLSCIDCWKDWLKDGE